MSASFRRCAWFPNILFGFRIIVGFRITFFLVSESCLVFWFPNHRFGFGIKPQPDGFGDLGPRQNVQVQLGAVYVYRFIDHGRLLSCSAHPLRCPNLLPYIEHIAVLRLLQSPAF